MYRINRPLSICHWALITKRRTAAILIGQVSRGMSLLQNIVILRGRNMGFTTELYYCWKLQNWVAYPIGFVSRLDTVWGSYQIAQICLHVLVQPKSTQIGLEINGVYPIWSTFLIPKHAASTLCNEQLYRTQPTFERTCQRDWWPIFTFDKTPRRLVQATQSGRDRCMVSWWF